LTLQPPIAAFMACPALLMTKVFGCCGFWLFCIGCVELAMGCVGHRELKSWTVQLEKVCLFCPVAHLGWEI